MGENKELLVIFKKCVDQVIADRPKMKESQSLTAQRAAMRLAQAQFKEKMRQDAIIMKGGGKPADSNFFFQEKKTYIPDASELKTHEKRAIVSHFLHND